MLENIAYVRDKDKLYESNKTMVYNIKCNCFCCNEYYETIYYSDYIEKICIKITNNIIYYTKQIIRYCKLSKKIYKKVYAITTKGVCY